MISQSAYEIAGHRVAHAAHGVDPRRVVRAAASWQLAKHAASSTQTSIVELVSRPAATDHAFLQTGDRGSDTWARIWTVDFSNTFEISAAEQQLSECWLSDYSFGSSATLLESCSSVDFDDNRTNRIYEIFTEPILFYYSYHHRPVQP